MPRAHAVLSPSASHRWLHCPPSAQLEAKLKDSVSAAAEEGTAAHALCEHKLKKVLKIRSSKPISNYITDEMEECSDAYVAYILEQLEMEKQNCNDPQILIEQHLDLSRWIPEGIGTADCILISDNKLHIIDFKYGLGVLVEAEHNSQMMIYALGAIDLFETLYDIQEVYMTIFQPRRENVSTWTISIQDLLEWAENVLKPTSDLAIHGEGEFAAGSWCTFCKASARCRKRAEENLKLAEMEFRKPPLLEDEEIEEVLQKIPELTRWANEVQAYASDAAILHGKKWSGFKVVESRTNRKYRDEDAVAETALKNGYTDIYKKSLLTITEMEKYVGKKTFRELFSDLVYKPTGRPVLVPESDKRKPIETIKAKDEFKEEN